MADALVTQVRPPPSRGLSWLFCCFGSSNAPREEAKPRPPIAQQPADPGSNLLPPIERHLDGRRCLVLDLDETLVHSSFQPVPSADFVVPIEIEGNVHNVYVQKRPHVDTFLKHVGERFEVVLFTASLSKYADPVVDLLDTHRVFSHRLFREHCVFFNGIYVKDLSRLGREVGHSIIIDNSPASYSFHPEHAVPITSWFDDKKDSELLALLPLLTELSTSSMLPSHLLK
eukprot:m.19374 g.19374  ORF g.19374 m.19374 type:complete len:229 (+) comp7577_c0_seq1:42-728(+)